MVLKNLINVYLFISIFIVLGCGSNDTYKVTGNVGKGSVTQGKVEFFDEKNTRIGLTKKFGKNGSYSISDLNYNGKIKAVLTLKEYHDEALNENIAVNDLNLMSISYIDKKNSTINITPLTDVAAKLLGNNAISQTKEKIAAINKYVAKAIGITDQNFNPVRGSLVFVNKGDGILKDTSSNRHAFALFAISNDSNITTDDVGDNVKSKVYATINRFYKAMVEASRDNTNLKAIIENIGDGDIKIKGINPTNLIIQTKTVMSSLEKDGTALDSFSKILNYADDNTLEAPTVQDYTNIGVTGIKDTNLNRVNASIFSAVNLEINTISKIQEFIKLFTINNINNVNIEENSPYISVAPIITGKAIGTLTYTLSGKDASAFSIDNATGIVSMIPRDFESPEDENEDNIYELIIILTDSNENIDTEAWNVTITDVKEYENAKLFPLNAQLKLSSFEEDNTVAKLKIELGNSILKSLSLEGEGSENFIILNDGTIKIKDMEHFSPEANYQYTLKSIFVSQNDFNTSADVNITVSLPFFNSVAVSSYKSEFTDKERKNIMDKYNSYLTNSVLDDTKYTNNARTLNFLSDLSALYLSDKENKEAHDALENFAKYIAKNLKFTGYLGRNEVHYFLKQFVVDALKLTDAFDAIDDRLRKHFYVESVLNGTYPKSTDNIYIFSKFRIDYGLIYLQSLKEKITFFKTNKAYFENFTKPSSFGTDSLKIDSLGFHHGAVYNAYMYAYSTFISSLKMLINTPYQISKESYINFRNAVYAFVIMSNKGTAGNALSGRHPFHTNVPIIQEKNVMERLIDVSIDILGYPDPKIVSYYKRFNPNYNKYLEIQAEPVPTGFWQFNYGNLGIYRQGTWLASIKGINKFFWGTEIYKNANRYGKYQSFGAVEIIYKDGLEASGMSRKGWDWNKPPGTTTIHIPFDKLVATSPRADVHNKLSVMGTAISFGGEDSFHHAIKGEMGLHATFLNYSNLKANKSVLAYDGKLLCLGSNIVSKDNSHHVATNLFQIAVADDTSQFHDDLDGNVILIDPKGTGYLIVDKNVSHDVKEQTSPDQSGNGAKSKAVYDSAFIEHGIAPKNESYNYIIVPNTNDYEMQNIDLSNHDILQQDNHAHIVHLVKEGIYAYALFTGNLDLKHGLVKLNNSPCLVILKEDGDNLHFKLVNPELFITKKTEIVLKGKWEISEIIEGKVSLISNTNNETRLLFSSKDGIPVEVNLNKLEVQVNNSSPTTNNLFIKGKIKENASVEASYVFSSSTGEEEGATDIIWQSKEDPFSSTTIEQETQTGKSFTVSSNYSIGKVYRFGVTPISLSGVRGLLTFSPWVSELPLLLEFEDPISYVRVGGASSVFHNFEDSFVGVSSIVQGDTNDVYSFTGYTSFGYWTAPESNITWGIYKLSSDKQYFTKLYEQSGRMSANSGGGDIQKNIFVRGDDTIMYGAVTSHTRPIRGQWGVFPSVDSDKPLSNAVMLYRKLDFSKTLPNRFDVSTFSFTNSGPYFKTSIKKVIK